MRRGFDKFYWVDEDITDWQRDVTNQLVLDKKLLQIDLAIMQMELNCLTGN
ncbi:hypothetical protein SOVF_205870 [Spinacia oleracea]|nr:hypothetical protein SOVF_205870 [Spinacia oleracea]